MTTTEIRLIRKRLIEYRSKSRLASQRARKHSVRQRNTGAARAYTRMLKMLAGARAAGFGRETRTMSKDPKPYVPEIGQAVWGCPTGEYECPEYIEALLQHLGNEIERVENNNGNPGYDAPTGNNGGEWHNDTFSMRAYYWGEDEAVASLPNFKCGDFEVRWYKWLGRGVTVNRPIAEQDAVAMFDACMASVRAMEKDRHQ